MPSCVDYAGRGFNPIVMRSCVKKFDLAAALGFTPGSFMASLIPSTLFCAPNKNTY